MTRGEIDAFFASLPSNAIYGLCDETLLERHLLSLEAYVDLCRREHVSLIQYRNKDQDVARVAKRLENLRNLWDGVLLINDHWTLCPLCDGVHIGQEDLSCFCCDRFAAADALRDAVGPDCILGLSTHNAAEIVAANTYPIDYIGLGAYRATGTKRDAAVLGTDMDTLASSSIHPVAAIGGVGFDDRFEQVRMRVMGSALMERAK